MGVPPVMDPKTVTNLFFRPNKRLDLIVKGSVVILSFVVLSLCGCQKKPSDTEVVWGKAQDVTEDLHHRLQAGIFEIGKDPLICELSPYSPRKSRFPFEPRVGAYQFTHISWERGSFWVKTDDHALIVIYLDAESALSHIQIAPINGFQVIRQFRELIQHPVREY